MYIFIPLVCFFKKKIEQLNFQILLWMIEAESFFFMEHISKPVFLIEDAQCC